MFRRSVMSCLFIAGLVVLGPLAAGATPALAGEDTWVTCTANGRVYLYTDLSKTTLVDAFLVENAPTRHRVGSGDFVIQSDQAGPGVDVVGLLTGTPYVFGFRLVSNGFATNPGGTAAQLYAVDWRVTAPGTGVVSEARNQLVAVYRDNEAVVWMVVADGLPNGEGRLLLSGGIGIYCPQF